MNYLKFPKLLACLFLISPCLFTLAEENFLLINGVTDEVVLELGPSINEQISPCSTFKMTLSLMGYDAGILKDENNPVWDFQEGYDDFLVTWKAPQTPQSWMKHSCVWYAKILALKIGGEKVQSYLTLFEYGNQDISGGLPKPGTSSPAWINSSLKISPKEQVQFIQKMVQERLPISRHALRMTKIITFKEELAEGWKLFGKTGWSGSSVTLDGKTLEHAWFVGWIEKDKNFFPFAYLIREQKIDQSQRILRVKQLLTQSKLISEI
ncbi:MAG: class D beta-lactamase [Parachlamydiaceae bacterium]|nr:class D beta-lactamase [Parachlamydiaceae bacterium]